MNCNGYFNNIDFEKEPLKPDWKTSYMNKKVDMVEVVRCKDCRLSTDYTDKQTEKPYHCRKNGGFHCGSWFCADGERKVGEQDVTP